MQEVSDLQDRVRIDQQGAKEALLGVDRLRRELVDAHGAAGASAAWGKRGLLVGEGEMTPRTVAARRLPTSDLSTPFSPNFDSWWGLSVEITYAHWEKSTCPVDRVNVTRTLSRAATLPEIYLPTFPRGT